MYSKINFFIYLLNILFVIVFGCFFGSSSINNKVTKKPINLKVNESKDSNVLLDNKLNLNEKRNLNKALIKNDLYVENIISDINNILVEQKNEKEKEQQNENLNEQKEEIFNNNLINFNVKNTIQLNVKFIEVI